MPDENSTLILKKKIKRTKFLIFIFTILLIILISLKIIYYISTVNQLLNEVVLPNTQIEATDVGGLNRKQLANINQKHINSLMEKKLTFILEKTKQTYTYQELGIMYDSNYVIQEIFDQQVENKWSGWLKKLTAEIGFRKINYKLEPKINNNKLQNLISNQFTKFQENPTNASIQMNDTNSGIYYVDEKVGKKINITRLQRDIIEAIYKGTDSVVVKYTNIYPNISNRDIRKINMKKTMSEFKTDLIGRSKNTRENIEKAANKLNGVIIPSNKEFSFNEIVGITDQTHGYKNAPVILNNKLIQAAGGGVCQVSSTLYNAVLLANLDILSRINHSHQVSYVPAGLDATVADNGPDFKFKNNTDTPIYIKTNLQNDQLIVRLFGKISDDIVNIYTNTIKKTDFILKVNTYREVKNKDNTLKVRELIGTSTYKNK
ncbi:VanW family protein [Bacillus cereus]|uniref:VanW family protein n=1 Tax=Bacillus TaxID=1386 RepID=UPI0024BA32D7|nr:VanW family protein [Bacillus cereus]WHS75954.1 VanW family protein [Bacillus cereus]